jgi:hypothetical protein
LYFDGGWAAASVFVATNSDATAAAVPSVNSRRPIVVGDLSIGKNPYVGFMVASLNKRRSGQDSIVVSR